MDWAGREMALARAWSSQAGRRALSALEDVRCVAWSQTQLGKLPCRPKRMRTAVTSQALVLNASDPELKDFFAERSVEAAYANTFLANIHGQQQGLLLQKWARQMLQEIHPEYEFSDPELGTCCNGSKRGADKAAYDFLMNGRRVEIKSSRMSRDEPHKHWRVFFNSVKLPTGKQTMASFDDLFLVIASPNCLQLIQHDLCTGISLSGKLAACQGLQVKVSASVKDICWKDALSTIVAKLCEKGSCKLLAETSFQDAHLQELLADCSDGSDGRGLVQAVYDGVPMCRMSSCRRGVHMQQMGQFIDKKLNPQSHFAFLSEEFDMSGRLRGVHQASADWIRDKTLVELKSSKLHFDKQKRRWSCNFWSIKPDCFNELWLAIYSPWNIRFYKSTLTESLRLSSQGVLTKSRGFQLLICGPTGEEDPQRALEVIERKLFSQGFVPQAIVKWKAPKVLVHGHLQNWVTELGHGPMRTLSTAANAPQVGVSCQSSCKLLEQCRGDLQNARGQCIHGFG